MPLFWSINARLYIGAFAISLMMAPFWAGLFNSAYLTWWLSSVAAMVVIKSTSYLLSLLGFQWIAGYAFGLVRPKLASWMLAMLLSLGAVIGTLLELHRDYYAFYVRDSALIAPPFTSWAAIWFWRLIVIPGIVTVVAFIGLKMGAISATKRGVFKKSPGIGPRIVALCAGLSLLPISMVVAVDSDFRAGLPGFHLWTTVPAWSGWMIVLAVVYFDVGLALGVHWHLEFKRWLAWLSLGVGVWVGAVTLTKLTPLRYEYGALLSVLEYPLICWGITVTCLFAAQCGVLIGSRFAARRWV